MSTVVNRIVAGCDRGADCLHARPPPPWSHINGNRHDSHANSVKHAGKLLEQEATPFKGKARLEQKNQSGQGGAQMRPTLARTPEKLIIKAPATNRAMAKTVAVANQRS